MSEHTKGPWRVSGCRTTTDALIEHGDDEEFSPLIAQVFSDSGRLPHLANARILAAAPDLLEALKIAKYAIRGINENGSHRGDKRGLIGFSDDERAMIDAAIAKAEGK